MRPVLRYVPGVVMLIAALVASRSATLAIVTGGSMAPTLAPGDVCVVVRTEVVDREDLVLFVPKGGVRPVVHRVVAVEGGLLHTKGDANQARDREPVPRSHVRGRVVKVVALGRLLAQLDSIARGDTLRNQSNSRP